MTDEKTFIFEESEPCSVQCEDCPDGGEVRVFRCNDGNVYICCFCREFWEEAVH